MKKTLIIFACCIAVQALSAVTVSFSAVLTNGSGNSSGSDLALGSSVEVGIWSGGSFSSLDSFDSVDSDFGGTTVIGSGFGLAGEFSASSDNIDTTGLGLENSQLAIRWTQGDGGFGIAYSTLSNWQLLGGNGLGSDTGVNSIDLSDLTDGSGTSLLGTAVIEVGSFGGSSTTFGGTPLFQAAPVPEPSTYAALAGFFALGWVMVRRRRA